MPSPPGAAAAADAALPPLSEGALIGAGVDPVVVVGGGLEELASAGCIIFSVRGTWNASTASRITPPIPA
jgi:hypothetical protein